MTDWRSCRVVRDRDGDLWTNYAGMWHTPEMAPFSADRLGKKFAPITPVLDANGLPVVTTVGDLTARHIGRRVRVGGEWDVEIVVGQVLHLIQAADGKPRTDIVDQRYEMADLRDPFIPFWSDTPCEVLDA